MQIRVSYVLVYDLPEPTPMIPVVTVHYTRTSDLFRPDRISADPRLFVSR